MLRLKLLDHSLCLMQVYGPNSSALYPQCVKKLVILCKGSKLTNKLSI